MRLFRWPYIKGLEKLFVNFIEELSVEISQRGDN